MSDEHPEQQGNLFSAQDVEELGDDDQLDEEMVEDVGNNPNEEQQQQELEEDPALAKMPPILPQFPDLTRSDKTLEEVLQMMDDEEFTPIIPDSVTDYYLAKNGFQTSNVKIKRLLALATQKFVSDIATDAYEYSRIRSNTAVYNSSNPHVRARALMMATSNMANAPDESVENGVQGASGSAGEGQSSTALGGGSQQHNQKVTLTIDDLSSALDEYGLNINRPQFYR
ncbi:hypothetical protein KL921_000721 [Ogataea angusta]|uniref:Transcription initiation factor TFIID subunit 10 n=1 Tax=Pichia angusta TaxID=870730 RepID=A0AAN6DIB3_PICAN|nr:uncharacterized protein KL928_000888 [Ogataea angusta]KAG7813175.1 hypothetical protein KL921_000721 [Ogataea angusta]KAG7820804.1 hypothetical protein KL928_000888 [Ogataea angusta]KAG7831758.1 hypothetical protein KL920_000093 [Ogataea angusta]KAG7835931.1 hypothetical protein KL943_001580 [Ogataea angusta]KAG7842997.1 hypothetical protein KL942_000093 [Ogataea angusta]